MYYPYLRGKQYELIAIRELAEQLSTARVTPIIEPVRESTRALDRAIEALTEVGGKAIVIVNPEVGDFQENTQQLQHTLLQDLNILGGNIRPGILLNNSMAFSSAQEIISNFDTYTPALLHAGFLYGRPLANWLKTEGLQVDHHFIDQHAGRLYQAHFGTHPRALISDGFKVMRNADYPEVEHFSDVHLLYASDGFDGFGDYLTIGAPYAEGGGPAYAVAIHMTFIDPSQDNAMFVYHFTSDSNSTPTDPGKKFREALAKLAHRWRSGNSFLHESSALMTFLGLHDRQHFPGLGFVKKLSIMHHIETLSAFLGRE